MTVRRRLIGPLAVFLVATAFVGTVGAQPLPFERPGDRGLTTDQVKDRIEWFLNRNKPGGQLPPGMDLKQFAELAKLFGQNGDPKQKLDPETQAKLKRLLDANPDLKKQFDAMRQKGDGPVNPGKGMPPFDPRFKGDNTKTFPDGLKIAPPVKRPPFDGPPPNGDPPQPPQPPVVDPNGPPQPTPNPVPQPPAREMAPWEQPESPQDKARQAAAAMWEKNVGPLDDTPAVKKALFEIMEGTGDLKDLDGNGLWDTLSKEFGDGKGFGDMLDGVDPGDGWKMPEWEFPKMNWNFNWGGNTPKLDGGGNANPSGDNWFTRMFRRSPPSPSSTPSTTWFSGWSAPKWNIGIPALDGTWLPVLFVIAAIVAGVFLWRWLSRRGTDPNRIDPYALGPWPVDPHRLATRQDVVIAFEHLSVLLCGPVAKTWTHTTIAGALSEMAMAEPARAMMLARLYELARYTPVDEPLTTAELAEARILVCRLAGFGDE